MRVILAALISLTTCLTCSAQDRRHRVHTTETGIDIGAAIGKGAFRISAGHQFADHWSLDASHTIFVRKLVKGLSEEERSHYEELGENENIHETSDESLHSADVRVRYWIRKAYDGAFIMTGCALRGRKGLDAEIGTGYSIKIWKGIRMSISYDIRLRDSIRMKKLQGNGIALTLSYIY